LKSDFAVGEAGEVFLREFVLEMHFNTSRTSGMDAGVNFDISLGAFKIET